MGHHQEDVSGCQVLASRTSGEAVSCNLPVRVMRREPAYVCHVVQSRPCISLPEYRAWVGRVVLI